MIKKVKVKELRTGMFISDLNCGWMQHPFLGSGRSIKVDSNNVIDKIVQSGIVEVYIDTELGNDVDDGLKTGKIRERVQTEIEEDAGTSAEEKLKNIKAVPIDEEIFNAKKIKEEAIQTVQDVMTDVTKGGHIEKQKVEHLVDNIVESIFRNKDALIGLGRLRQVDEYLYTHSMNVCAMMVSFLKYLDYDTSIIKHVGIGAMLHDIGISKVPSDILNKKSALSDEEFEKIKGHVEHGRILLEETGGIADAAILAAYHHHERLDGSGYPNGLKGNEINELGQALAIIDVYDALTTKRCYRGRIQPTEALKMLYEWGGVLYNEIMVQKFIRCVGLYPVGSMVRLESGMIGVIINHSTDDLLRPVVRIVYDTHRDHIIMPYTVDLSQSNGDDSADKIVSYASPEEWNLQPEVYL
jgi:HD-GYP domain-containing protein (c-di-GMP phosphodiesterase class II)